MSDSVKYLKKNGPHNVAIICLSEWHGQQLLHLSQDGPRSWVIRDYVNRREIRCTPNDEGCRSLPDLAEIEKMVSYQDSCGDEAIVPIVNVNEIARWSEYLKCRTSAVFRRDAREASITDAKESPLTSKWVSLK